LFHARPGAPRAARAAGAGVAPLSARTPVCDFGWKAPAFELPATDGKTYRLGDVRGANGLLVMFICNHCPYVKAIREKLVRDCRELAAHGIGCVAISANDPADYPEDSFDNMKRVAAEFGYPFPYLFDETQAVARAYGAVCTPDFFGFNSALELQYRGRLDASGAARDPGARRELFEAMTRVAESGQGPAQQTPSIGCSIKWKQQ
jgi:peroxiredoxin